MRQCLFAVALLLGGLLSRARADEIPCSPMERGAVQIDGLLMDWKGVQGVGADDTKQIVRGAKQWSGPDDLSFDLFCSHDADSLYLAINVKDDYFIRTPRGSNDDHVILLLGGRQLRVFPGDMRAIKGRMSWGARGRVKGIEMAEALQKQGYSVELRIPFKQLPGFRAGAPSYAGAVQVADCDSRARQRVETVIGTSPSARGGSFAFSQARAELDNFLRDRGHTPAQVRRRFEANVVGDARVEQVVLVGRTIGVIGEGLPGGAYFYLDLPVQQDRDIYWVKLMDLNGDGRREMVARYVERAGNGRRELIAVFRFNDADRLVRSFAHEILKGQGDKTIVNRFSTVKRRRKGRRPAGVDLVFDRPVARGFSKETFHERPGADCYSILLPWGEEKRHHVVFEGEEFTVR